MVIRKYLVFSFCLLSQLKMGSIVVWCQGLYLLYISIVKLPSQAKPGSQNLIPPFTPTMIYLGVNFTSLLEGLVHFIFEMVDLKSIIFII